MPITLVTGLPGHGKTLYTLARYKDEAVKEGRPVFHNNIKGLNIPGWQVWDVKNWENLPAGALFVIDEAQFAFPVRGRGNPDPFIENLATHRHLGLDFVVITQNPMLLDSFVRRLVDRHFHVVRKFGTQRCTVHEFANGAKDNCASNRTGSIRHEWKYPKEVFGLYTSAELHTVKRRIPMRIWLLFSVPVVFAALAGVAWYRLQPEFVAGGSKPEPGSGPGAFKPVSGQPRAAAPKGPTTPLEYAEAYTPRVAGLPHTAPVYDEATRATVAPYPAACIASAARCQCYTQQATRLDTGEELCRQIAAGGFFVGWGQPVAHAVPLGQAASSEAEQREAPRVASLGGDPRSHVR